MKVTFLGTSHGVVEVGRHCTSMLVETGDNAFLIDAGAPVADLLTNMGVPFTKVKALFNTHFHDDHICGAIQLLTLINWYATKAEIDVFVPDVLGIKAMRDFICATDGSVDTKRIRFRYYEDGFRYEKDGFSLRAIRTGHVDAPGSHSHAFVVEAEGKRILFSGDLRSDFADLPDVIYHEDFDLIVIEGAHQSVDGLLSHLRGAKTKRVMVNHIFVFAEKAPQIEAAAKTVPFDLRVANDGDVVEL